MFWLCTAFKKQYWLVAILLIFSVDGWCLLYSQSHKKIMPVKEKKKGKIKNKEIEYTCYFDPKQVHDSSRYTDISTGILAFKSLLWHQHK